MYKTQKPSKLLLGHSIHHQVRATLEPICSLSRGGSGAVDAHLLKGVENERQENLNEKLLTLRGTQGRPASKNKKKCLCVALLAALGKMQENKEQDEKKRKRISKDPRWVGLMRSCYSIETRHIQHVPANNIQISTI